jgi:hypothetical protein
VEDVLFLFNMHPIDGFVRMLKPKGMPPLHRPRT